MHSEFSTPLAELPTFLSTISMVKDDRAAIVQSLIQAERKSPSVYEPSRDLFLRVLEGRLDFDKASIQARRLNDEIERRCAIQILDTSEHFLKNEQPVRISRLPGLDYVLPNGLHLNISPIWLRHFDPCSLMVLHFWQAPLFDRQLAAAAAVLRATLLEALPQYSSCQIDFVSVAFSQFSNRRRFELYNWLKLMPLNEADLHRFWAQFMEAWCQYQHMGPREIKRKRTATLFNR
jgi:hypothetical protein